MSTDSFRGHARARVDAAVHQAYAALRGRPERLDFLARLLAVARGHSTAQIAALRNLVWFEKAMVRAPELWPGATGHPLAVIHSLAGHLLGRYPTPRFLAWVWFSPPEHRATTRHGWFVAHAGGQRLRGLRLPIPLTRRMEHELLRTPDHLDVDRALRRAEVLGLGGSPALARAILGTRLARSFDEPERWRAVLRWLVGCGASVEPGEVRRLIELLHARPIALRGRSFASVMREVDRCAGALLWPRSRWREMIVPVDGCEWSVVELTDSAALAREGRVMRHCVATYARDCARGWSRIWSLRRRCADDAVARSVLTIEVDPCTRRIVQLRGRGNRDAGGWPLELVRRWAEREGLAIAA